MAAMLVAARRIEITDRIFIAAILARVTTFHHNRRRR
jgi:hypothetical protein